MFLPLKSCSWSTLRSQNQGAPKERRKRRAEKLSQPQSITQKGVHTHLLTAREREHWFLQHLSHFLAVNFRASIARTPFCAILWRSPRNGCPKGGFLESPFLPCPLQVYSAEKKRTLQKPPFGQAFLRTTPLRSFKLAHPHRSKKPPQLAFSSGSEQGR